MIDAYLKSTTRMEDHVIHLLFSANRWESAYVNGLFFFFFPQPEIPVPGGTCAWTCGYTPPERLERVF